MSWRKVMFLRYHNHFSIFNHFPFPSCWATASLPFYFSCVFSRWSITISDQVTVHIKQLCEPQHLTQIAKMVIYLFTFTWWLNPENLLKAFSSWPILQGSMWRLTGYQNLSKSTAKFIRSPHVLSVYQRIVS